MAHGARMDSGGGGTTGHGVGQDAVGSSIGSSGSWAGHRDVAGPGGTGRARGYSATERRQSQRQSDHSPRSPPSRQSSRPERLRSPESRTWNAASFAKPTRALSHPKTLGCPGIVPPQSKPRRRGGPRTSLLARRVRNSSSIPRLSGDKALGSIRTTPSRIVDAPPVVRDTGPNLFDLL